MPLVAVPPAKSDRSPLQRPHLDHATTRSLRFVPLFNLTATNNPIRDQDQPSSNFAEPLPLVAPDAHQAYERTVVTGPIETPPVERSKSLQRTKEKDHTRIRVYASPPQKRHRMITSESPSRWFLLDILVIAILAEHQPKIRCRSTLAASFSVNRLVAKLKGRLCGIRFDKNGKMSGW